MLRHSPKILLVLPWCEPGKWVFTGHGQTYNVEICSVPELHGHRTLKGILQSTLRIARHTSLTDCIVSWEASSAIATRLARSFSRSDTKWIALGIIPKTNNRHINRLLSTALSGATAVTCFSNHDTGTLRDTLGVQACGITPTVWHSEFSTMREKSKEWLAVGASNRDDFTVARAAEGCGIRVARYARQVTAPSDAFDWHINANPQDVEDAFHVHRYHLAILRSSGYASGLSVAVRAGFATQLLIASDTPQMRELIRDQENGLLVRLGDSAHLAEMIRMVLCGDVDVQKVAGALRDDCLERHTYAVLRKHIEMMVDTCI
ncbi:MAG: hypothetical protein RLZZ78_123 [Armatimonadota bacterium]